MDYLDFDLHLSSTPNGYRVRATNAQGATALHDFVLPFNDDQLKIVFLSLGMTRQGAQRHIRLSDSPQMQEVKNFGGKLFDAVFAGEVMGLWRSSVNAVAPGKGVRLRLRLTETPELGDLPWEFLYDKTRNQFVALLTKTPIVRFLDLPTPIQPLQAQLPLRVLVVISDPSDYDPLDVEREWTNLQTATQALQARGAVTVTRLPNATLSELRRALRQNEYHVLHFIGHGAFVASTQDGELVFKNEQGRGQNVSSQTLAMLLANFDSLRLVVLNACEGARPSRNDPFAGIAPSLVQQDKPAVIAMQFAVSDRAALAFADEFYSALASGDAVDTAVTHARTAIFTDVNLLEWGTPVLYMRAPNGIIFDLTQRTDLSGFRKPERSQSTPEPQIITPPAPKIEIPARLTNKAGQEMILIPAGDFMMGSNQYESEKPIHEVYLDAFYISRYPVTNAEYKKFKSDWQIPNGKENHPVVNVNWDDAATYCEWLNGREGDKETGKQGKFRLPTEAEWEKAASWDEQKKIKRVYPWGDTFDKDKCNASESNIRDTTVVGKYSPRGDSFYGVGDMAGNVWEWCADWFDENFYKNSPRENPLNDSSGQYRVLRGGSFLDEASFVRCAGRFGNHPDFLLRPLGFRVVAAPVRL